MLLRDPAEMEIFPKLKSTLFNISLSFLVERRGTVCFQSFVVVVLLEEGLSRRRSWWAKMSLSGKSIDFPSLKRHQATPLEIPITVPQKHFSVFLYWGD